MVYDAWNRLVEVKDHSGTTVTSNEYDGLNRRIVRDETGGSGKKTHYYYNNQWQVLEERIEVGGVIDPDPLAQYLYHPHYVDSIAMRRYDANTDGLNVEEHFYLQDANFNVTAVIDDTGTVVERYGYTPYGEVTVLDSSFVLRNSSLISNEIQYTGRRLDPETGLQLNRNRFYAAHLGRWVNRDPIGYAGGMNLHEYVGGMPTYYFDPSGLAFIHIGDPPGMGPTGPIDVPPGFGLPDPIDGNEIPCECEPPLFEPDPLFYNISNPSPLLPSSLPVYDHWKNCKSYPCLVERSDGSLELITQPVITLPPEPPTLELAIDGFLCLVGGPVGRAVGRGGGTCAKKCCTAAAKQAARKGIRSLRRQINTHRKKLADYIKNPAKFDNKGKLIGIDRALRAKIIAGRIAKLKKEIAKFENEIKKLLDILNCL